MKRMPELRGLTNEHHRALVFAKKAKRAVDEGGPAPARLWREAGQYFREELDRHFDNEEVYLGRPLEAIGGQRPLAERLYREHRALRAFFQPGAGRSPDELLRFAELLVAHVRFEERELFEAAQEHLAPEVLAGLDRIYRPEGG